jgi:hypothetical protein
MFKTRAFRPGYPGEPAELPTNAIRYCRLTPSSHMVTPERHAEFYFRQC